MKCLLCWMAALLLLPSFSFADPLPLAEDLSETVTVFYNGEDETGGSYRYSYTYPYADPEDPTAYLVNTYYEYLVKDTLDYRIPNLSDYYSGIHLDVSVEISYEVTCNNEEYFSVLIHKTENVDGEVSETWNGDTFSRKNGMPGSVCSLPNILGILDAGESDEWLENRQARKIQEIVRNLVWELILENRDGIDYDPGFPEEDLELVFDPEMDFWLDETGNPVFFILPGRIAPEEAGLLTYSVSLETIRDEI